MIDTINQTLIPGDTTSTVLEGFGKGAFVVIKALTGTHGMPQNAEERPF